VRVRGLSVGDHETLSALRQGVEKVDEVWMYRHICDLCALCIVDEAGKRLLTPAAVEQLKQEHAVEPLLRIWEAARRLSGLTATQEDLEKN
jgi:hypothetical protein